ncbi:HAMP domain-containing histidine kinase [Trichocoleus desertorum AS-A10]|uniref:sensor histidine kinase n=1 Tax=Trichocoleus desertorum TaxID=1481672 RepID=UPI003298BCE1
MATQPNSTNLAKADDNSAPALSAPPLNRLNRFFSVSAKINCGYALALSIAVIGTTVGLVQGHRAYEQARHQMDVADDEGGMLSSLQGGLLEIQTHQRELALQIAQPQAFQQTNQDLLGHVSGVQELLAELREFAQINNDVKLSAFLQQYGNTVEAYTRYLEAQISRIDLANLPPEEIPQVQQVLSGTVAAPETIEFHQFIHELAEYARTVRQKQAAADEEQSRATVLQAQIILASVGLSIAIAAILAFLTSRTISRPIESLTRVTQKITEESNFDLQAPVTTRDEIGLLAVSFNQLVQRVKQLLEEQAAALEREREMQEAKLIQSEKMSSLGRMLAGVAHEINNPVNFIYGNLSHAHNYIEDLLKLLRTYETEIADPPPAIQDQIEDIDLEFLAEDLPKVLDSMKLGADRARQIVLSLKNFSRLDDTEPHPVNLHDCLDSTLLILNNRIKKDLVVTRNYGDLPVIEGFAGLLYQVFMNLLSNAIDALEEKPVEEGSRQITIVTQRLDTDRVMVKIIDNGMGMPPEVQAQVFDMFFTTKPRGVGTGMGLAISHQIIVEKHGGTLECHSTAGVGTEFAIALPIKSSPVETTAPVSAPSVAQV